MQIYCETPRLQLRTLEKQDARDLFEMDSDPEVHQYLGTKPVQTIAEIHEIIENIQNQYKTNGIGRWAVLDKKTNECLGWCGLKFHNDEVNKHNYFYDLGYRFKRKHWGMGYASEASKAVLNFGFKQMDINTIFAMTDSRHHQSKNVLFKLGFRFVEHFDYYGDASDWFCISKTNFLNNI